jgi:hypothetical protein
MKMVMKLSDFATSLSPMLRRFNGRAATEDVRQDVEGRIKRELVKHCVRDDSNFRVVDVAVTIEAVGEGSRLAIEWI